MTSEEFKAVMSFSEKYDYKWPPMLTFKGIVEFKNLPSVTTANLGDLYVDNDNMKNYWFFDGSNWQYIDNTKRCPHCGRVIDE